MQNTQNEIQKKTARKERRDQVTIILTGNKKSGNNKSFPINNYFSVNGLNSPIKTHRVAEWTKKKIKLYVIYKKLTVGLTHTLKPNSTLEGLP